ncbi:hypothetical protein [Alicyclobacillus acidoterrestris]|uniref:Uncharacterized protein n=1 Tax=Alicyclobacillus acidoterrestris (strain ATCC 49025 / DSM 3922 / CIP 106132 / NCIMB 13137 / GD3B) TaxID=1356854 RepID=T0B9G3_ALIAG|nr:hypothetical protein [Alicyclobacillus acidoterrestris]EPZ40663.1 hypothetical protein N007_17895 [Alicyclobacillus acidoterrestris ATCC 49025]UNO49049.1 hypothetical protein K1I37_00290 [Alicyclobacillus acidoterrestris]
MCDKESNNVLEFKFKRSSSMDTDVDAKKEVAEIIDMVNMLNAHERRFEDILSKMQAQIEELRIALHEKDLIIGQKDSEIVELQISLLQRKS